jgi:hypothetical protein
VQKDFCNKICTKEPRRLYFGGSACWGGADIEGGRLDGARHAAFDPERSLQLRRSTGIPALPNVKTACSRRGIVPAIASV